MIRRFDLAVVVTAALLSFAAGVPAGRYYERRQAVAHEVAYYHPQRGVIVYGVLESRAVAVALCQLYNDKDKDKVADCAKFKSEVKNAK